ncbi:MAG: sigma 54-interacting transcriptional regulator [Gemmatimonadetes bacterium]|nr:sigma 54-interacting transcriptional regulator [Gemmatimonadota bacterium]
MDPFDRILGQSDAAQTVRGFGRRAALVDAPVLLLGESGTGKGVLARAVHDASARGRGAFIAVNCAGIPESLFESEFFGHTRGAFTGAQQSHRGLIEQAHGGTLFLDEIGELPLALQAKLLTVLEDGQVRRLGGEHVVRVDARVMAASGLDLERAVAAGRFRRDLYHRLLVLSFHLPPLRERAGDVEFLARHFLERFSARYGRRLDGFDPEALAVLGSYAWPGNVRELAHAVEAAVLACGGRRIGRKHLPRGLFRTPPEPVPSTTAPPVHTSPQAQGRYSFLGSAEEERRIILETLRRCRGNKTRTAHALGMARTTLRLKLRLLGLNGGTDRSEPIESAQRTGEVGSGPRA